MSNRSKKGRGGNRLALPKIMKATYKERQSEIFARLAPNSVAIFVSNPERQRSNDTDFPYRQSSDILYINGFPEPEAAVVFVKRDGKPNQLVMFVRPKDPSKEVWTGVRIGAEGARKRYLADRAYTVDQFEKVVAELIKAADTVYYKFGHNPDFDKQFTAVWQEGQKPLLNPETIVHEMRLVKSAAEVVILKRASDISVEAHIKAMQTARPGLYEFEVQAEMEKIFTANGAAFPAYSSIEACGNNACTLHYVTNRDHLQDGDLMLIDAACEYEGYASDITRTFPVNGKFTEAQRQIYELVLKSQMAGIRAAKPGSSLAHVHSVAAGVLRRGLVDLGILSPEMRTRKSAMEALKKAKQAGTDKELLLLGHVFMHGTSHMMGLDVHDVGLDFEKKGMGRDRKVTPGMVFTVEPGLYLNENDKRIPEKYRGIGIRIEDDVLITETGNLVLTDGVPKTVAAIEKLMAQARG